MIKIRIVFEFKSHKFSLEKTVFGFSITRCSFLQSRAGQYKQKLISLYFLSGWRYNVHISVFSIWIKQINKVNVTM